ncbi:type II toxin-antitoxin system RelB/DinJ family antitoxin [Candidatus Kaiserbacteria bacterium]|nr:type II toxin-antitoxin system RelB/DinJ family antitoxin [Candidatus Kaiserbacteria bacterium]
MNTKTTILIKTDKKIKVAAQKAAKDIGIPLSTVLGMYLRKFAHERRIEFEASLVPNAKTIQAIKKSQKEYERGGYTGPFSNLEDLHKALST